MNESARVNVAISRAKNHFIIVGEINALERTYAQTIKLNELPDIEKAKQERLDNVANHDRLAVFKYFIGCSMVRNVSPLKEVGMGAVRVKECKIWNCARE